MKAVAFDLDGVIVDALEIHRDAFVKAWNEIVGERHRMELSFHDERLASLSTRQKIKTMRLEAELSDDEALRIETLKQLITSQEIDKAPPTVTWLPSLMRSLKNDGRRIALVSNSIHATCERVLNNFGIVDMFDVIVGSDDVTHGKPNPYPYKLAASMLGVPSKQLIAVEDSVTGLRSAKDAGCWVYAVSDPSLDLEQTKFSTWLKLIDAV